MLDLAFASVVRRAEQDSESSEAGKVAAVIVAEVIGVQDFVVATEHNPARRNEWEVLSLLLSGYAFLGEVPHSFVNVPLSKLISMGLLYSNNGIPKKKLTLPVGRNPFLL